MRDLNIRLDWWRMKLQDCNNRINSFIELLASTYKYVQIFQLFNRIREVSEIEKEILSLKGKGSLIYVQW